MSEETPHKKLNWAQKLGAAGVVAAATSADPANAQMSQQQLQQHHDSTHTSYMNDHTRGIPRESISPATGRDAPEPLPPENWGGSGGALVVGGLTYVALANRRRREPAATPPNKQDKSRS
jgi:hypothetical protein